jgi:hypothetical protein
MKKFPKIREYRRQLGRLKFSADKKSTVLPRHLIVPMRFRTYSKEGQLINIWGKNENEEIVFQVGSRNIIAIRFLFETFFMSKIF